MAKSTVIASMIRLHHGKIFYFLIFEPHFISDPISTTTAINGCLIVIGIGWSYSLTLIVEIVTLVTYSTMAIDVKIYRILVACHVPEFRNIQIILLL